MVIEGVNTESLECSDGDKDGSLAVVQAEWQVDEN